MTKETINKLLNEKGYNATMVAKSLGVTPQAVHKVINCGNGSMRIVKAIAKVCDSDYTTLFPYYLREKENEERKKREEKQRELDKKLAKFA